MTSAARAPGVLGWSRSTNPERFETYTRWSLYLAATCEPLVVFLVVVGAVSWNGSGALVWSVAVLAHYAAVLVVLRAAMAAYSGRAPLPRPALALLLLLTLACVVVALTLFPGSGTTDPLTTGYAVLLPLAATLLALSPVVRMGRLVLLSLAAAAACALATAAAGGGTRESVPALVSSLLITLGVTSSCRVSIWMLGVVREQVQRREVDARLAVAEERLRFSRDLHDVFGRTLATVSVKSELAAELAKRGDPRGAEQMLEVRRIAHDALAEVRAVVDGYRATDLPAELAGAREILRSAGVDVRVAGEGHELPAVVAEPLAWAVREAVTNVVRHSRARTCRVEVVVQDGRAVLVVENDGALPRGSRRGAGLSGLQERLAAVGGTLTTDLAGDVFTLRVEVPYLAGQAT